MPVRTRFAPSPTGYLHVGGARTALFSQLFARRHGGQFVLRIEDTDRARSTPESIQAILDGMAWLQLDWDEGPIFQSARMAHYAAAAERLLASGLAYRCWCTAEELDARRGAALAAGRSPAYDRTCRDLAVPPAGRSRHVVRFRAPLDGDTVLDDVVKGRIVFQNAELDDLVIVRSDGTPVYNFCAVVDDAEMAISDVIRGDDHIANTARQILLYRALDAALPRFAHVPMILGADKTRLSKRHGATSVTAYRDMGYLPAALVNYLARLGWSHGDQELFTRAELIEHFALDHVAKAAAVFNPEKLLWVNFQHLKGLTDDALAAAVVPFLEAAGLPVAEDRAWLAHAAGLFRERAKTLVELASFLRPYLLDTITLDGAAAAKHLTPAVMPALADLVERLSTLGEWTAPRIETAFHETLAPHGLALGKLAQPVRVAVTGGTVSPGIFDVLSLLGQARTLARLRAALAGARASAPAP